MRFSRLKRLDEASKIARTAIRKCANCGELHPTIKKDATEPLLLIAKLVENGRQTDEWKIYPHTAAIILDRISDETVVSLGKKINSHPRNCVLTSIKVPSVTIRPDVKKMGGGRSTNDDLTTMLQIIVKKSAVMPNIIPDIIEPKLEKAIFEINNSYYEFVRANGEGAMSSLALRFKGKTGRFRKNQLGKRARKICRSTIVGDRYLQINEIGIPLVFAKTIQYDEVVQEYNKQRPSI